MINAIINGLLNFLMSILNLILTPVNLLFENAFPELSAKILNLTSTLHTYIGYIGYFVDILPSSLRSTLVFILSCSITIYTIKLTYRGYMKIIRILHQIKFW